LKNVFIFFILLEKQEVLQEEMEEVPSIRTEFGSPNFEKSELLFPEKVFARLKGKIDYLVYENKTPLLVVDSIAIKKRYYELIKNFPDFKVHYAVKANDNISILELLATLGSNFEVASTSEIVKLVELGVSGSRMITSNPIKPLDFIEVCRQVGINYLCADSKDEIEKIKFAFPDAKVYIRLEIENKESSWPLSGKFGLTVEEAKELINYAVRRKVNIVGLTFHTGSQNNSPDSFVYSLDIAKNIFDFAKEKHNLDMYLLNMGGGFPIEYISKVKDIQEFKSKIYNKLSEFKNPEKLVLQMEPGRRVVGESGVMVSKVIGKAVRDGENWLYIDVGVFNGMMEVIGNMNYIFKTNSRKKAKTWNIGGPSCDSMDVVAKNVIMPEPEIGDFVYILSTGAYTTVYAAPFNGYRVPTTIVV